jgi:phenylacetate-CoA ligase
MLLPLPTSRAEIDAIQASRKRRAVEQARRAPFYAGKLDHIDLARLDDPAEWRKIPILTKDALRALSDRDFYTAFCVEPEDGIAEYWRSGGTTGAPAAGAARARTSRSRSVSTPWDRCWHAAQRMSASR